jgi:Superinfection immunity protein
MFSVHSKPNRQNQTADSQISTSSGRWPKTSLTLLPTIIAFKVKHHYAWPLAGINVFFGFTGLGWLGIFVWALIGPRKSALDGMSQHSALGLAKAPTGDPAGLSSGTPDRSRRD